MHSPVVRSERGGASIEFVWATIVLVFVMMFVFRIFQVTIRGTQGLTNSAYAAFSTLGRASTAPGMQGRTGLVYTEDVMAAGPTLSAVGGCLNDCANKLQFQYVGPNLKYSYGLSSFFAQIKEGLTIYLH